MRIAIPTPSRDWWSKHNMHVYGVLGLLLSAIGVLTQVWTGQSPRASVIPTEVEGPKGAALEAIVRLVRDSRAKPPNIVYTPTTRRDSLQTFPELNYHGFRLLEEHHVWDLRAWKRVEPIDRGKLLSPIVLTSRFRLEKTEPVETYPIPAYTSGVDIYSRSPSHEKGFAVLVGDQDRSRISVGGTTTKAWRLLINVIDEPLDVDFQIHTVRTYWNTLQEPSTQWVGTAVRQRVHDRNISMLVLFPKDKPFTNLELVYTQLGTGEALPYDFQPEDLRVDPKHEYVFWNIVDPKQDFVYRIEWSW